MAKFVLTAQLRLQPPTNLGSVVSNIRSQLQGITATVNVAVPPQAQAQLKSAQKNLNQTAKAAKQATTGITGFGEAAALAGKRFLAFTIAGGAIVRFAGSIINATKEAIAFERQMNKIQQATGSSAKAVGSIASEISRLGKTFGVSSIELSKAAQVLAQAGLSADETRKSLQALAKSDLAPTFDSIANTTEGAVAIFRQFRVEAEDLEGVLGSLNAVAGKFAVESSDIVSAIRRTGGAFAAAGGSLNELMALFTSVRATTRESADSIATGFRTIFTRLQRVRTQNFLQQMGIDLQNLEGQFVGPYEAVRRLSTALKDLPGTDPRFAQIIEELGGFRQISKVIPLIQQFETSQKALNVAMAGTGSLSQDAATAQKTLAVQIQKTREQFQAMIRNLTESSGFKGTVKLALQLASALIKMADSLKPLIPLLTAFGAIAIGRSIGPFFKGFKQKGGFGLGFAGGGLVPGTGNRDTVPAVLTPGEFVLRKDAVKALGLNRGGRIIQRFIGGGTAEEQPHPLPQGIGAITLRNRGQIQSGIAEQGTFIVSTSKYKDLPVQYSVGSFSEQFAKQIDARASRTLVALTNNLGQQVARELGTPQTQKITDKFGVANYASIIGGLFEGAITTLGTPFTTDQAAFDFPQGLVGRTDKWSNGSLLSHIPVDAKRTWDRHAKDSIIAKTKAILDDPALLNIPERVNWKSGEVFDPATHGKSLGISQSDLRTATRTLEALQERGYDTARINEDPKTKRRYITYATGGKVPALLTPGEVVVDKGTAQSIGYGTLEKMNYADKYADGGMIPRNLGDIRRARRRRLDEEGNLTSQAKYYAQNRNRRFAQLGQPKAVERTVGYLDGDVLADPANAAIVNEQISKLGIKGGASGYHNFLIKLATQKRKMGQLKKFQAIYGAPGSGKTSMAMGSPADQASLRKTKRIPILTPADIDKVQEVIDTVAFGPKLIKEMSGGLYSGIDRLTILSSSTKEEQEELNRRRALRDQQVATGTAKTAFGRNVGMTKGAPVDTGAVEAVAMAELGKRRTAVLGIQPGFKLRRKGEEEIPALETKKLGLFYGALSPTTVGHADTMRLAQEAGIDPKDLIVAVSKVGGTAKKGDEHSQRTAVFTQGFRMALAQKSFPGATVVGAGAQDFMGTAPTVFERPSKGGRRQFVRAGKGSVAFVGDDKEEPELMKYRTAGYDVNIGARSEISGTAARQAIMEGNAEQMKKLLTPGAMELVQKNQARIQARAGVLPELFERTEKRIGSKADVVTQQLSQYPAQLTAKMKKEQPEIVAQVEALRKQRDAIKRLKEKMPIEMLRQLTRLFPQKYGFLMDEMASGGKVAAKLTPGEAIVDAPTVKAVGSKKLESFNRGGLVRKYAAGGPVGGGLGGIANISFAAAGISGLVSSFDILNDSTKQLIGLFTTGITQFAILNTAISGAGEFGQKYAKKMEEATQTIANAQSQLEPQLAGLRGKKADRAAIQARGIQALKEQKQAVNTIQASRARQKQISDQFKTGLITPQDFLQQAAAESSIRGKARTKYQGARAAGKQAANEKIINAQEIKDLEDQINPLRSQIGDARRKRINIQNRQAAARAIGTGFAAGGAFLTTAGGALENYGRSQLEQGGDTGALTAGKAIGTAGSYAATGAAVGALFGPIGIAVGGAAGAIIGFTKGLYDANKEITNFKILKAFNQSLNESTQILDALTKEQVTYLTAQTAAQRQAQSFYSTTTNPAASEETRNDAIAQSKTNLDKFSAYLDVSAKDVNNFNEFINKAGPLVFHMVAQLSNIPSSQLRAQFEKIIESNKKAKESTDKLRILQDQYANSIRNITNVAQAFETTALGMQRFSSSLDQLMTFIEGTAAGFKVLDESVRLGSPDKILDPNAFNEILNRDIRNNPALNTTFAGQDKTIGVSIADNVAEAAQYTQDLPNILLKVRDNIDAFGKNDIMGQLLEPFADASPLIRNAVEQSARQIIGGEGKDEALIDKLRNDITGVQEEIIKAWRPQFEIAQQIAAANNVELNRRLEFSDKLNSVLLKEIELKGKSLDVRAQSEELLAKAQNRPVDLAKLQDIENQRQSNILGPDAALANRPIAIGIALEEAKNKVLKQRAEIDRLGIKASEDLLQAKRDEELRVTRLNMALQHLSDVGGRTAVTMQKIEQEQAKGQFRQGLGEKFTFAETPKELRDFGNVLSQTRVAAQTGDIGSVLPQLRGDVLDMLNQIGNVPLGVLGGKTGKQVKEDIVTKRLTDQLGLPPDEARRIAEGQTTELQKQLNELTKIAGTSQEAADELVKANANDQARLVELNNVSIGAFQKSIKELIARQDIAGLKAQEVGDTTARNKLNKVAEARAKLEEKFGPNAALYQRNAAAITNVKNLQFQKRQNQRLGEQYNLGQKVGYLFDLVRQEQGDKYQDLTTADKYVAVKEKATAYLRTSGATDPMISRFEDILTEKIGTGEGLDSNELMRRVADSLNALQPELRATYAGLDVAEADLRAKGIDVNDRRLQSWTPDITHNERLFAAADEDKRSTAELTAEIDRLNANLAGYTDTIKSREDEIAASKHAGGWVYGHGIRDSVPARLTPGEFVLSRNMVRGIGRDNVAQLAGGGIVDRIKRMFGFGEPENPYLRRLDRDKSGYYKKLRDEKAKESLKRRAANPYNQRQFMGTLRGLPGVGGLFESAAQKRARRFAASPMTKSTITSEEMAKRSDDARKAAAARGQAALAKGLAAKKLRDDKFKAKYGFAMGSLVPGSGSGDKIPALLEPGEFVFNRNAVAAIGAGKLSSVNKRYSRYQAGGAVKMAAGGAVAGFDISLMDKAVQNFGTYVDKLGDFADSIKGLEIQLKASHTVEVILNGAQVLAGMQESIKNLVVAETNKAINSMLDKKFNLPPME